MHECMHNYAKNCGGSALPKTRRVAPVHAPTKKRGIRHPAQVLGSAPSIPSDPIPHRATTLMGIVPTISYAGIGTPLRLNLGDSTL